MDGEGARAQVDWEAPWLAPYQARGQRIWARWAGGMTVAQALNAEQDAGLGAWPAWEAGRLRFVPQEALPAGQAYEAFIRARAEVPTRDNLHDFFNGLVWLSFPRLKIHLNRLHGAQLPPFGPATALPQGERGPVRDALTLFDENGALCQGPAALQEALVQRDWRGLFLTHRAAWGQVRLTLVGHALLEKLCRPRKNITAHAWTLSPTLPDEDGWPGPSLARLLVPERLVSKPWTPLPVLGVPGWWADNEAPSFYEDATVFRPPRGWGEQLGRR